MVFCFGSTGSDSVHGHPEKADAKFARLYENGDLEQEVRDAEAAYGPRKQEGVAMFLGPRMGE